MGCLLHGIRDLKMEADQTEGSTFSYALALLIHEWIIKVGKSYRKVCLFVCLLDVSLPI